MSRQRKRNYSKHMERNNNIYLSPKQVDLSVNKRRQKQENINLYRSSVSPKIIQRKQKIIQFDKRLSLSNRDNRLSHKKNQYHSGDEREQYQKNQKTCKQQNQLPQQSIQEKESGGIDQQTLRHYEKITEYTQKQNQNLRKQNQYLLRQVKKAKQYEKKVAKIYNKYKQYKIGYIEIVEELEYAEKQAQIYEDQCLEMANIIQFDFEQLKQKVEKQLVQAYHKNKTNKNNKSSKKLQQFNCPQTDKTLYQPYNPKNNIPTDQSEHRQHPDNNIDISTDKHTNKFDTISFQSN